VRQRDSKNLTQLKLEIKMKTIIKTNKPADQIEAVDYYIVAQDIIGCSEIVDHVIHEADDALYFIDADGESHHIEIKPLPDSDV
jgi:hypothetical protein